MSDSSSGKRAAGAKKSAKREDAHASDGVLANLPRTRPQRASARRDASRLAAAQATSRGPAVTEPAPAAIARKRTPAKGRPAKAPAQAPAGKHRNSTAKRKSTAKRLQDPAPRQGFESESDSLRGPVQPPGRTDLLASAAELAGELTKTGLASGGRLLKDVLSRLPLN
ncbi:MAG TPA: hypothetical protein VII53_06330 [Solirubrobacteraceae bacterium]